MGFFYTLTDSLTSLSLSVVNGFSNFYAHFDWLQRIMNTDDDVDGPMPKTLGVLSHS